MYEHLTVNICYSYYPQILVLRPNSFRDLRSLTK